MSDTPEKNYYPITESSSTKEGTPDEPQANMSNAGQVVNIDKSSVSNSNIVTIAGGSLLKSGYFQSSNYVKGLSGFFINSDGSVEFGDGEFRGEITATSGAIGGFVIGADYLRDVSNSFGLSSTVTGGNDVRFWAGSTFANRDTAPLRIYEDGSIYGTNVTLTGAMNATSGWIGSATALLYESEGINTGTTGYIRGGQTAYNTGLGYFLGYDAGAYKFSIGNGVDKYIKYDGSNLTIAGSVENLSFLEAGEDLTEKDSVQIGGDYQQLSQQDTYVDASAPTTNYNGSAILITRKVTSTFDYRYILLQYDISNLPVADNISSAVLYMYASSVPSPPYSVNLQRNTTSWDETTVTWNTKPTLSGSNFASFASITTTGWKNVDITTQVKNWRDGTHTNYGMGIGTSQTFNLGFDSENGANPPYLLITMASGKVYKASAKTSNATTRWLGFCRTTTSEGDDAPIQVSANATYLTGLTTDSPYYQSDTRGAISTSAGTVSKKIGLSLSTTELLILNS